MRRIFPYIASIVFCSGCGTLEVYPPFDTANNPPSTGTGTIGTSPGTATGAGTSSTLSVEDCSDNIDNDGDGLVDCNDPDCDSTCDFDNDGYQGLAYNGADCDDTDANVHPGVFDVCDSIDNDCNGTIDGDRDNDGYTVCNECNDNNNTIYPGASGEVCGDGVDTDCDGDDCLAAWTASFETGFGPTWVHGGNYYWLTTSLNSYDGSWAAKAGPIGNNQSSHMSIELDFATGGDLTFWHTGDTESNYDFMRFYVDGTEVLSRSGNWGWTEAAYAVPVGTHTFQWTYAKDGSLSTGLDNIQIDYIVAVGGTL
ncbi:MAG: hypothetical protein GWP91_00160 [Rhodobacterales bacterium]|nr:hypothetical protein [Rhodobacterales bacterium]